MSDHGQQQPVCRCGSPCKYYGPVGGYSKQCIECNQADAFKQRLRRAAKKEQTEA